MALLSMTLLIEAVVQPELWSAHNAAAPVTCGVAIAVLL
jgi:hypothetical protein